ncbi:peptide-methionine (S)-S-oxide reductase MsrA [Blastococcus sp. Marseille-P5729]|uniref:peptide-methionine (S)-S-oxide reductase MsrA n=1 Tax=Blastococcus sp. Marseille-P5729 TaxID=2086582 RepID=UPI000D10A4B7|nr:peptide-methionine (S)-S-oxide reductase MsrA [Blastococcus sp. Marseille-P5729]
MVFWRTNPTMVTKDDALPGRDSYPYDVPSQHAVLTGATLDGPWPEGSEVAVFGMGCFWGVERIFWQLPGVLSTSAGYAGGYTPHPTYEETCTGRTGHAEVVRVTFDPAQISYEQLLKAFFENHDPTTKWRQGNDIGTQYRSLILTTSSEQAAAAERVRDTYQRELTERGYGEISTEIAPLGEYYLAEDYHQQYLHKNPNGYCNHGFNGVACPVGLG